ncbi:MAG: ERCC4 domain-containing protein [Promethearchaeia archaeon]
MTKQKQLNIILDIREQKLMNLFDSKNDIITYRIEKLDVGDIVVSEKAGIERKEGGDFISSIMDNRLFDQLERLKDTYEYPILILERLNDEVFDLTDMKISSIYGALAYVSYKMKISVIPTRNLEETGIVIKRIAYREQVKDESPVLSRKAPTNMDIDERRKFILEGLIDTGPKKAEQLISRFKTPFRVLEAIKYTKITYTRTGNPKGIQGPLDMMKGFGWKFIKKNKEILFEREERMKQKKLLDDI